VGLRNVAPATAGFGWRWDWLTAEPLRQQPNQPAIAPEGERLESVDGLGW
jgi:hypothetical protein